MIADFNPAQIKVLVFDVDDTVTRDTLGIKIQVFKDLFSDRLDLLQEGRELYEFTGKGDRYNIIAHTVGESQENCVDNPVVQEWAQKFEEASMAAIRAGGIHRDDVAALIALKEKFVGKMYLLSATPEASVQGNIAHFETMYPELAGMFQAVIGTPMDGGKAGELAKIALANNVDTSEVLMVGDGGSDYNGATTAGTQFVTIIPEGKSDKWPEESFPKLSAISQLPTLLGI